MQPQPLQILISPLDWGLGHASRCIPLIRLFVETGHIVTLAGSGRSLILLQKEFPSLSSIEIKGFSPEFKYSDYIALQLIWKLPAFISMIIKENRELKNLIKRSDFDVIISDNRYGFRNKHIKSIFITHQVMIKAPVWLRFAEYPLYLISKFLINQFDECWIPDYKETPGLGGDLSHKYPLPANALFIGPLSRFMGSDFLVSKTKDNIIAIISGTEPQRSNFENLLIKQIADLNIKSTIISGKPESTENARKQGNLTILHHATIEEMRTLIEESSLVICRSGYSSIMDMETVGAKILLFPTPGQTEQQYLAELHEKNNIALWRRQVEMDLKKDIPEAMKYIGFTRSEDYAEVKVLMDRIKKK